MNGQLTVSFLPWWPANPYQTPLEQELTRLNAPVVGSPPLNPLRQFRHLLIVLFAYRLLNIVWCGQFMSRARTNHATLDETSGSLMLASAMATPIIASAIATPKEHVGEDCDILFAPSQSGALTQSAHKADVPIERMAFSWGHRAEFSNWAAMVKIPMTGYEEAQSHA